GAAGQRGSGAAGQRGSGAAGQRGSAEDLQKEESSRAAEGGVAIRPWTRLDCHGGFAASQ
ncbi:MAG TPA: hypothetical protein VFD73_03505, partial [Gemmatimonadales bacterium]|nr:hypothetical protein [Gemmatimonadales bacterium]